MISWSGSGEHIVREWITTLAIAGTIAIGPASSAEMFRGIATLTGVAKVADGDGVLFGKVEIRLQGIAAPEDNTQKRDPDGPASGASLRALVENKPIVCQLDGTVASSNRPVGVCYLGDVDIGEYQVRTGHARDCPPFSGGRYAKAEAEARASGRDLSKTYALPDYCRAGG